ncbi:MAG: SprB repeat-containing protein, partial [Bacteroidia bacterium]|nr:SprB repeat-containing protein [Bacteroidia bacterium]
SVFCDSLIHCSYYKINSSVHHTIGDFNTGSIYVSATGTPPFSYSWANGETVNFLDSLGPGTYCVTITDSYGCLDSACQTIVITSDCQAAYTVDFIVVNCGPYCWLFEDASLGDSIVSWHWNFDDSFFAYEPQVVYTFPAPAYIISA